MRHNRGMRLSLVVPQVAYKDSFLAGMKELKESGLPWLQDFDLAAVAVDFDSFVKGELAKARTRTETLVPETKLWGICDGLFAGKLGIRHELNDSLRLMGGHIGYDTVPAFRGKGVATFMLREALPMARALGLKKVLLTCDDNNLASIRVIESNGGELEGKKQLEPGRPAKRYYWIQLQ